MSEQIVRVPNKTKKEPKYCYSKTCYRRMDYVDSDREVKRSRYHINTVLRCSECGRLWVVRPTPFIILGELTYNKVRPLRWYHYARYQIPRQVQA